MSEESNNRTNEELLAIIEEYKKSVEHDDIEQLTEEWYNIRKTTVGGSEIAAIIGSDPYKTPKSLLKNKLFPSEIKGNPALAWGTILEEVTNRWCEMLLDTKVIECGSVNGVIPGQRYSADGITIAKIDGENKIILTEYKSPYYAEVCNEIPPQYYPQVQIGLKSIPICDASIFISNYYRSCSLLTHLSPERIPEYNNNMLFGRLAKSIDTSNVLAITVIYMMKKGYTEKYDDNYIELTDEELMSKYSSGAPAYISKLLSEYDPKLHEIRYGTLYKIGSLELDWCNEAPVIDHQEAYINLLDEHDYLCHTNSDDIIHYAPIKLYKTYIEYSEGDDEWYQKAKPLIENFIKVLTELAPLSDEEKLAGHKSAKFSKMK